jgi:hypothetical protein
MTIATTAGRPKGSTGNGKTMKEIVAREERKLARIEFDRQADEARAEAENITRITAIRAQQRERKFDVYDKQEAKRAPQFQIDQSPILWLLISLAAVTFITTAMLTADGTIGAAAAAKFSVDWFGFVLFGVFEVATLAFMLMYYILGSRVDYEGKRVKSAQWFVAMVAASAITVGLSAYHVLDLYNYDLTNIDVWVGISIRVVASIFFVLVSKGIATALFAKSVQL